eukprot:5748630-Pleurochrysis_carterae.AAC.1
MVALFTPVTLVVHGARGIAVSFVYGQYLTKRYKTSWWTRTSIVALDEKVFDAWRILAKGAVFLRIAQQQRDRSSSSQLPFSRIIQEVWYFKQLFFAPEAKRLQNAAPALVSSYLSFCLSPPETQP